MCRVHIRTQRAKVDEAGEGDNPESIAVNYIAAKKLEDEPMLDTWASGRSVKQTDQKAIS